MFVIPWSLQWPLLVQAEKSKIASKMAAWNKYKRLWYMDRCTDFMFHNSSNLWYLFL